MAHRTPFTCGVSTTGVGVSLVDRVRGGMVLFTPTTKPGRRLYGVDGAISGSGFVGSMHDRCGRNPGRADRRPRPGGRTAGPARAGAARTERAGDRGAARQGEADRPGADRAAAGRGFVQGGRAAPPAPGHRVRPGGQEALHRRCHHRLGHGRGPHGLRLRARLPDLRRGAGRGPRHEDPQDHGHGHLGRRPAGVAERRRRRPYPGGRLGARRLRRHLPAQHARLRCHPADQRDARPVRGRRGLQPGADRLRVHGP